MNNQIDKGYFFLFIAWVFSLIAMLGSLFFSEIMEFPPCALCWYQRIAMYPLVAILLIGFLKTDKSALLYALPLALCGWLISLYHILLANGIIPETASPCREGISCSTVYLDWFGFITIPRLSFVAFSLILVLLVLFYRRVFNVK